MRILVGYASRRGATKGIAERISQTLEAQGVDVVLKPVQDVTGVEDFDAFVLGSSAYMGHWERGAAELVRKQAPALAERPVWLFSSGPVGSETVDKQGRDVLEASRPEEFTEFGELIHPRELKVFFGAYDPQGPHAGFAERLVAKMPAIRDSMPAGDFRNWPEIETWARSIAAALQPAHAMTTA